MKTNIYSEKITKINACFEKFSKELDDKNSATFKRIDKIIGIIVYSVCVVGILLMSGLAVDAYMSNQRFLQARAMSFNAFVVNKEGDVIYQKVDISFNPLNKKLMRVPYFVRRNMEHHSQFHNLPHNDAGYYVVEPFYLSVHNNSIKNIVMSDVDYQTFLKLYDEFYRDSEKLTGLYEVGGGK